MVIISHPTYNIGRNYLSMPTISVIAVRFPSDVIKKATIRDVFPMLQTPGPNVFMFICTGESMVSIYIKDLHA